MKKITIISLIILILAALFAFIFAVYLSFTAVKPAVDTINQNIEKDLASVVRVPKEIPPPIRGFEETIYYWEMETIDKEVVPVRYKFTPAFGKGTDKIIATLEMAENADPSIFGKVIPAIITDEQSLAAAKDPAKANLGSSEKTNYSSIKLALTPNTNQTIAVIWEFEKKKLSQELNDSYRSLNKYPDFVLRFLYGLPSFTISLFSA